MREHGEGGQATPQFDVSLPVRLRQRLGPAASSLEVVGLFSGAFLGATLAEYSLPVALCSASLVAWFGFRSARSLKAGSTFSFGVAVVWWMIAAAFVAKQIASFRFGGYEAVGLLSMTVPTCLLARGLLAFWAYRPVARANHAAADPLRAQPWEGGARTKRRPRLLTLKSATAYAFLLVAPAPYLLVWSVTRQSQIPADNVGDTIGYLAAQLGIGFLAVLWGVRLYRRARREAMLPGGELLKQDRRPLVLYLRSFRDDRILMRARATDGRILFERLAKISFEEVISDHLWGYGPVLAIADPNATPGPTPLGAARVYANDATWQERVIGLMHQASMIVAITGSGDGFAWEINTIARLGLLSKLVLVIPPAQYWRRPKHLPRTAPWQLPVNFGATPIPPLEMDLDRTRAAVFPRGCAALITADAANEWTYEAVLDEAALVIARDDAGRVRPGFSHPVWLDPPPQRTSFIGLMLRLGVALLAVAIALFAFFAFALVNLRSLAPVVERATQFSDPSGALLSESVTTPNGLITAHFPHGFVHATRAGGNVLVLAADDNDDDTALVLFLAVPQAITHDVGELTRLLQNETHKQMQTNGDTLVSEQPPQQTECLPNYAGLEVVSEVHSRAGARRLKWSCFFSSHGAGYQLSYQVLASQAERQRPLLARIVKATEVNESPRVGSRSH